MGGAHACRERGGGGGAGNGAVGVNISIDINYTQEGRGKKDAKPERNHVIFMYTYVQH